MPAAGLADLIDGRDARLADGRPVLIHQQVVQTAAVRGYRDQIAAKGRTPAQYSGQNRPRILGQFFAPMDYPAIQQMKGVAEHRVNIPPPPNRR